MIMTITEDVERKALQAKLDKMATDLEEVRLLNSHFQEDQLLQLSHQKQTETVCEQVEMETARTILRLRGCCPSVRDKIGDFIKGMGQCGVSTAFRQSLKSYRNTSASLKFTVLNPKGRIWTMVAGGGASVIYADTVSGLMYCNDIAILSL
ncbi:hypothetical protein ACFX14_021539 [Malus domestica]